MAKHFLFHLFLIDGQYAYGEHPTLYSKLRDIAPRAPIVLYCPTASDEEKKKASELGVKKFFGNPLPDDFVIVCEDISQASRIL